MCGTDALRYFYDTLDALFSIETAEHHSFLAQLRASFPNVGPLILYYKCFGDSSCATYA